MADRRVHGCAHFGVLREQLADVVDVTVVERREKPLDRRSGERVDLALHRRPALEAVSASDDQLRIGQRERVGRRRLRVQRGDSRQRVRTGGPGGAQQFLRAFLLHLQVRTGGQGFDENGPVLFGRHDDTSSWKVVPAVREDGLEFVRQR